MQKISAGLLMYRIKNNEFEVFLVHPGGPFWKDKDEGVWSIPKGEVEEGEDFFGCAKREFEEETGIKVKAEKFIELGSIKQKSGKIVHAWAFEGDWLGLLRQNMIEIEFPYKSGKTIKIPEVDKAGFFNEENAKKKMSPAQFEFAERLKEKLKI
ncbi:NUDIX domain-containing protein [Candidatus Pacearchaeota archaeon]|nr:NUDIX domain-containing protein [Candidatus Pacearchaeota archaeon]